MKEYKGEIKNNKVVKIETLERTTRFNEDLTETINQTAEEKNGPKIFISPLSKNLQTVKRFNLLMVSDATALKHSVMVSLASKTLRTEIGFDLENDKSHKHAKSFLREKFGITNTSKLRAGSKVLKEPGSMVTCLLEKKMREKK